VSGPASAGLTVTLSRALLLVAGGARLLRCACLDSRPMPNGAGPGNVLRTKKGLRFIDLET
jgi:hypothetical protein